MGKICFLMSLLFCLRDVLLQWTLVGAYIFILSSIHSEKNYAILTDWLTYMAIIWLLWPDSIKVSLTFILNKISGGTRGSLQKDSTVLVCLWKLETEKFGLVSYMIATFEEIFFVNIVGFDD